MRFELFSNNAWPSSYKTRPLQKKPIVKALHNDPTIDIL